MQKRVKQKFGWTNPESTYDIAQADSAPRIYRNNNLRGHVLYSCRKLAGKIPTQKFGRENMKIHVPKTGETFESALENRNKNLDGKIRKVHVIYPKIWRETTKTGIG